jgi:hypothetical protein
MDVDMGEMDGWMDGDRCHDNVQRLTVTREDCVLMMRYAVL